MPSILALALSLALTLGCALGTAAQAATVQVAVASNFAAPMRQIAAGFERDSGHTVRLAFGASGAFGAQIRHGAPFDLLLAADAAVPQALEAEGLAVPGSRFTYAIGRLVLWSASPGRVDAAGAVLRDPSLTRLAVANPKLAPYGQAAVQVMQRLGVSEALRPRWVQGENIAQTHQFVASGNATAGFVALSQVIGADGGIASGSGWVVPPHLHDPIRQDAVLLVHGRDNPAATALLAYLRSAPARAVMARFGYAH